MNKKTAKKFIFIILAIVLLITMPFVVLCCIYVDNKNIQYEDIVINLNDKSTQEIKIVHLSDLHFPKLKVDIDKMIEKLNGLELDFIAITGDLIDSTANLDQCGVKEFIDRLIKIAPIYYVNGNHEVANKASDKLYDYLLEKGVFVLMNEDRLYKKGDLMITIIGISDNENFQRNDYLKGGETDYRILLAHRPEEEKTWTYVSCPNDEHLWQVPNLVLSGHAHGGQFIFNGKGVIAPNQGFFPTYYNGRYELTKHTTMVVSRGLGNSIIPFRFNNPPHIPIIRIKF